MVTAVQSSLLSPRSGISQPKMPWGRGGGWGSNLLPRAPVQASVATRQAWDGSPQLGVTQALPRGLQSFPTVPRPHVYEAAEGSIKHKDPGRGQGTGAGGGRWRGGCFSCPSLVGTKATNAKASGALGLPVCVGEGEAGYDARRFGHLLEGPCAGVTRTPTRRPAFRARLQGQACFGQRRNSTALGSRPYFGSRRD